MLFLLFMLKTKNYLEEEMWSWVNRCERKSWSWNINDLISKTNLVYFRSLTFFFMYLSAFSVNKTAHLLVFQCPCWLTSALVMIFPHKLSHPSRRRGLLRIRNHNRKYISGRQTLVPGSDQSGSRCRCSSNKQKRKKVEVWNRMLNLSVSCLHLSNFILSNGVLRVSADFLPHVVFCIQTKQ